MSTRVLRATSLLRHRPSPTTIASSCSSSTLLPSRHRYYATEPDVFSPREGHGSSSHPRDRLRFADEQDSSSSPSSSTETPPPTTVLPASSSSSSSENNTLVISSDQLYPNSSHNRPTFPRVPFSTHRFVRELEHAEVPRDLATELMKATRTLIRRQEDRARDELLGRQDLENEAYLFTAAITELKTGSQVKSRNDGVALRSMTAVLQRETDAVSQQIKEDMQRLQSDIQLDMNNRKEETSQELKQLDMNIMDLNSKFTILLGEVRTEIEATKWISTRRVMTAIIVVVVSVLTYMSSRSPPEPPAPPPPSIEELGVTRVGEEAEVTPIGGWGGFFGGGKKVGEEDNGGSGSV